MIRSKLAVLFSLLSVPTTAIAQPAAAIAEPSAEVAPIKSITPAERLGEGWWQQRWEAKLAATREGQNTQLVLLGDSITQFWEEAGKQIAEEYYAKYHRLNLGFSGDHTQNLLWRLQNDKKNLEKLSPKVAVLLIGTNNTGHDQQPAAHTTAGIKAILDELRATWPKTKILLLAIFPRGADANDPLRKINDAINTEIVKFADGKSIVYFDISSSFLAADGTPIADIMPDKLHLSAKGYEIWAKALDPKLKELGL